MVKDLDHEGTSTSTQVDLGEDLLEATRTHTRTQAPPPVATAPLPRTPEKITDDLQSAKILLGEGLIDDAKRILRKILIADPGNAPAKQMLGEILDRELQQIFGGGAPERRRFTTPPVPDVDLSKIDPEALMKSLDRDLELGLFAPGPPGAPLEEVRPASAKLAAGTEAELKGSKPRDRIDVGIALFELGNAEAALKQFHTAYRQSDPEEPGTLWHSASCLMAQTQILLDRAHEAVEVIQSALRSGKPSFEEKLELVYLMGKATEKLGNAVVANSWYRLVAELDPIYRDVQDRIARTAR